MRNPTWRSRPVEVRAWRHASLLSALALAVGCGNTTTADSTPGSTNDQGGGGEAGGATATAGSGGQAGAVATGGNGGQGANSSYSAGMVTVSGSVSDSVNTVAILIGVAPSDPNIIYTACEWIVQSPASFNTPLRVLVGQSPCDTGAVALLPGGQLVVYGATMIPGGDEQVIQCTQISAIVDGDITVALPAFTTDCDDFPFNKN